jgi:hypothetical protein
MATFACGGSGTGAGRRWWMNRSHPAIALALDGFDKDWIVRGVSQGVAQAHDGAADALLKIHKDVRGPESLAELLARDDLSGPGQHERQGTEWQVLKAGP